MSAPRHSFYEFFAGGGMARLGLGTDWECLFANDFSEKKASAYRANFPDSAHLTVGDVAQVRLGDLPGRPDAVWASFPCQDLSLAGDRRGLDAARSGAFWPFWRLMEGMVRDGRPPRLIVLENVVGTLFSNGGRDFATLLEQLNTAGYCFGPLVIDAVRFVPQSRPRLFIVAVHASVPLEDRHTLPGPSEPWHTEALRRAYGSLPPSLQANWVWWLLPLPDAIRASLSEMIEDTPSGVRWHTAEETARLLTMMSPTNRRKVELAGQLPGRTIGTIYKRTRLDENKKKTQRAEVRFDGVSGCLRTPAGGSSRQLLIVIERGVVRTRLMSTREAARLMGVPDTYELPANYNDGYHLMGDGLAVPVVSWLATHLLSPILADDQRLREEAA